MSHGVMVHGENNLAEREKKVLKSCLDQSFVLPCGGFAIYSTVRAQ